MRKFFFRYSDFPIFRYLDKGKFHIFAVLTMALFYGQAAAQSTATFRLTDNSTQSRYFDQTGGIYFQDGTVVVRRSLSESAETVAAANDIRSITFRDGIGITAAIEGNRFSLFPNPVENNFSIKGLGEGSHNVEIFSLMGTKMAGFVCSDGDDVEVADLPRGIYFVRVEGSIVKFVKR